MNNNSDTLSYSMVFDRKKCIYPKYRHHSIKNPTFRVRGSWVDDSLVHNCQNCNVEFSFFLRKHHCRNCGRIFCSSCSNFYTQIENKSLSMNDHFSFFTSGKSRVCKSCYTSINEYKKHLT